VKNDTTKRPLAENYKATDIWERLASITTDLCSLIDRNYIYLAVNDSYLRAYNRSREEIIGHSAREILGPEIFDQCVKDHVDQCLAGKQVRYQAWFNYPTLGRRFVDVSYHPFLDVDGIMAGVFAEVRDITDLQITREALRQSEERYRTVLEEMEESYYEVDLTGNLTFVNDALCRQLGYSREELKGMNYQIITTPDDAKNIYKTFNQSYITGQPIRAFTSKIVRKDGITGLGEISVFPLRNDKGEITGFRGMAHDVTERMQMEEALRQSEERYRTVLEQMEEAYYELDLAGNFTFVNDAMCRQLGYSREELIGMHYQVITPPENIKKASVFYNKVYGTGKSFKATPMERIRKDGTRLYVESSVFPLRNERGEIIGARGITRDITGLKQAEEEKRQMEQKAQLASRLACVGELASGVAHEINNPLTGVVGYTDLLLARKDIPQDIRRDLKTVNKGAQRVADIVKKLLTFAGQQKPERKLSNINEIVSNTLDLQAYELASNNIKVDFQPAHDLPKTIVDPGQLQQVFLNLIQNAETEMKLAHGGGKLSIKTEQIGNTIRISFKDSGPGIAKENLERIFNPFFTTREVGQGTGLGLSVCHGIIAEHKGMIWAESKLSRGATFFVELPIVTRIKQSTPPEPAIEEPKKVTNAKILVLDDEPSIRQIVSRVLSKEGHEVEAFGNAEDALERIKSKRYNLILLDIKTPGIGGIKLYKQLQDIAASLPKRVVFITGDTMDKRSTDFLAKTKAPHIMKPFDTEQLKTDINRILSRK
jgi:PAS domain S-box-containing protein